MMDRIKKLEEMIAIMKVQYPQYEYVNILTEKGSKYNLGENSYAIVIRGVKQYQLKEFHEFLDNAIMVPIVEADEELPIVITLENCDIPTDLEWFEFVLPAEGSIVRFNSNNHLNENSISAEDYSFAMAA